MRCACLAALAVFTMACQSPPKDPMKGRWERIRHVELPISFEAPESLEMFPYRYAFAVGTGRLARSDGSGVRTYEYRHRLVASLNSLYAVHAKFAWIRSDTHPVAPESVAALSRGADGPSYEEALAFVLELLEGEAREPWGDAGRTVVGERSARSLSLEFPDGEEVWGQNRLYVVPVSPSDVLLVHVLTRRSATQEEREQMVPRMLRSIRFDCECDGRAPEPRASGREDWREALAGRGRPRPAPPR